MARVQRSGNTIEILSSDYSSLTIYLNDEMFDLEIPVRVTFDGRQIFEGSVTRSPETMRRTLRERSDLSYIYPASITVQL